MGTGTPLPLDAQFMSSVRGSVQGVFPNISEHFDVTSLPTDDYNCIAWAADDTDRWWWPTNPDSYWPVGVERKETIESFANAFAMIGYVPCDNGDLEVGLEKVVIYCVGNIPKHMARQLYSGSWTSKLGPSWDITHHQIDGLAGDHYGLPTQFLARQSYR